MLDEQTQRFLERQRLAHLATADTTGAPHVVPICFALIGTTIYIAIDEKPKTGDFWRLRRLRNIADNPRVAIVADVYDDQDWSKLGFVLVRARARILSSVAAEAPVTDLAEQARAIRTLRAKYPQYVNMALEERPTIAADIESVTAWGRFEA
jgi:PPOX class probable F420-dependent enzyme